MIAEIIVYKDGKFGDMGFTSWFTWAGFWNRLIRQELQNGVGDNHALEFLHGSLTSARCYDNPRQLKESLLIMFAGLRSIERDFEMHRIFPVIARFSRSVREIAMCRPAIPRLVSWMMKDPPANAGPAHWVEPYPQPRGRSLDLITWDIIRMYLVKVLEKAASETGWSPIHGEYFLNTSKVLSNRYEQSLIRCHGDKTIVNEWFDKQAKVDRVAFRRDKTSFRKYW